ncbi:MULTISPECIES: exopolysaccharide biosynthesis polyprenyl glycosylphosphotransferase [unclassified Xanthobacter]|uniref:exopolysaccharide biosynthesis polyprenyl glycosylphosphotransferase n=1 Tax=unclassified Xanthobacter TaxID=2623496 RepID=UPI001EE0D4CD|nr:MULTISPECIES: exopolysaccharide biosynthesis polyprenyl glycosylphosphotransferase [unclassified Xanthobacter]
MTRWTHGLINRFVIVCDVVMSLLAAIIAHVAWDFLSWSQIGILWLIGIFSFVQILQFGRAYRVEHYSRLRRQIGHVVVGGVPAGFVVGVCYYALIPTEATNFKALMGWGAVTAAALLFGRLVLVRLGMVLVRRKAVLRRHVAVLGERDRARALVDRYEEEEGAKGLMSFVGIFTDDGGTEGDGVPVLSEITGKPYPPERGGIAQLLEYAKDEHVDMVVVTKSWAEPAAISAVVSQLHQIAVDVIVELDPRSFSLNYANLTMVAGEPALQVQQQPFKGSLGLMKAIEDYVVATIGLLITSPILLAAALAIKLESPGPILFKQPRVGRNNKVFMVYKFRSMTVDLTDDGSAGTSRDSPRITRVGRFLRASSIDELPQLLNVLKGDMSIVGPRPHVPNMLVSPNVVYEAIQQYVSRYRVKPGITGWAQINGSRGPIQSVEKAERRLALDLYYIENWSIWLDLRIMLLTITKGMAGPGVF